ncbi:cupin domain-containing protein [Paraliomyxa miuraensis]|uniref:cupin domain-containing protein n=1 Tax=Paraliomyxa miuraensis TaxID=376150 RepID=UPI0022589653|nr:cupin domain-containing protein [Paraliomyxa miuraensis]MCX4247775.1 hypothetical protein [Paraliomyxa miuraensis]
MTADELFQVLVQAAGEERAVGEKWHLRFFLDGEAIDPPRELLPRVEDQSLEGHAARVEEACPGRGFGIILNNYHRFDARLWARLRDFFGSWFSRTGFPPGGATADVFVGNYSRTPFGVHRDTLDVFTSVVAGRKRLLAWPAHVFEGVDAPTKDYSRYLEQATVLEGEAGDLFYWPSSHWHIAESTGGLTATLALGEFRDPVPDVLHADMVRVLERARFPTEGLLDDASHHVRSGAAQVMPDPLREAVEVVSESLRRSVVIQWAKRVSNHGLVPPPPRADELSLDEIIRCPPDHPIVVLGDGDLLILGASGRMLPVPDFPQIVALVEELNTGARVRVEELVQRYSGESSDEDGAGSVDAEALLDILQTLHSFRAFEVGGGVEAS